MQQEEDESLASAFCRFSAIDSEFQATKLTSQEMSNLRFLSMLKDKEAVRQYGIHTRREANERPAPYREVYEWMEAYEANGPPKIPSTSESSMIALNLGNDLSDDHKLSEKEILSNKLPTYPGITWTKLLLKKFKSNNKKAGIKCWFHGSKGHSQEDCKILYPSKKRKQQNTKKDEKRKRKENLI
jgi:hypothetical protein